MGLLKSLLIIVLIFYAFSMIVRMLFKHKMKKLTRKMEQAVKDETEATPKTQNTPHVDPNIGEYTDYEEVE